MIEMPQSNENKTPHIQHSEPYCPCLGVTDPKTPGVIPRIALSLSGCGFLGVYHIGSISCMMKHGKQLLRRCDGFAGASAGALVACLLATCPEKIELDCVSLWYDLADEVIGKPFGALTSNYSLINRLEQYVDQVLPADAHKLATGRLHISVTCRHAGTNRLASQFGSREQLLKYLIGTCYIPFYAGSKRSPPVIDGLEYIDGGLSSNLPKVDGLRTIKISPFSGEADICPEDGWAMFDWQVTLANQIVKLNIGNMRRGMQALFPPNLQVLEDYYKLGYINTMKFLIQHGCYERDEGTPVSDYRLMSLITVAIKQILSLFQCLAASFKRILCFWGRKRIRDDHGLPMTIQDVGHGETGGEFEDWDSWGAGSVKRHYKTASEHKIEAYRQRLSVAREEMEKAAVDEADNELKYFENLQPEFKPVKKIVLKSSNVSSSLPSQKNRFAVQSDVNVLMSNMDATSLGDLDDTLNKVANGPDEFNHSWDVDEGSLNVDGVLKEAKHKQRQQRLEEQRRKKAEKQRLSSKHSLEVVKLS